MDQPQPMTLVPEKFGLFMIPFEPKGLCTLIISHKHGSEVWLCMDEATANTILFHWVKEYWHDSNNDEEIPKDEQDAIDMYFDDHPDYEYYDLTSHSEIHHMVGDLLCT